MPDKLIFACENASQEPTLILYKNMTPEQLRAAYKSQKLTQRDAAEAAARAVAAGLDPAHMRSAEVGRHAASQLRLIENVARSRKIVL